MVKHSIIQFLEGIASYECVFIELRPGSKVPTRSWELFENYHHERGCSRLDLAYHWLDKGSGVGYLPRNGLAAIDCDDSLTVQRVIKFATERGIELPRVKTPRGGRHFLFCHAPNIDRSLLKNHVCHPKECGAVVQWDFKLGPRTMLVAPGTIKLGEGGVVVGEYVPGRWIQPPSLDIRELSPGLEIYRQQTPFLRNQRPEQDRIMAAMTFLNRTAPCTGKGARKRLWEVAIHAVAYHDLDPGLVLYLMTTDKAGYVAWNNRCVDEMGSPFPWSRDELFAVLLDAVDASPSYGVIRYQKLVIRQNTQHHLSNFFQILKALGWCDKSKFIRSMELYEFFRTIYGIESTAIVLDEFGGEIHRAISTGIVTTLQPHRTAKSRGYRGADTAALWHAYETLQPWRSTYFEAIDF